MTGELFIDPNRCIGCRACEEACSECPGHGGHTMIHLDYLARATSVQPAPTVCMHCEEPACIASCPADAIKKTADGVVQSALQSRCIGCSNCVLACPFGVPRYQAKIDQMMKCDLCYDRTSAGKRPMCVSVCPSGALYFGTREEVAAKRREKPVDAFDFGGPVVRTKVRMMTPTGAGALDMDVEDLMAGVV